MKEKEIKKFECFRKDDEGVYYYYYDKDGKNIWTYNLDHLEEHIIDLQDKLNKIKQYCKEKPLIYEGGNREISCYLGNLTETEKKCYELALEEVEEIIGGNDSK